MIHGALRQHDHVVILRGLFHLRHDHFVVLLLVAGLEQAFVCALDKAAVHLHPPAQPGRFALHQTAGGLHGGAGRRDHGDFLAQLRGLPRHGAINFENRHGNGLSGNVGGLAHRRALVQRADAAQLLKILIIIAHARNDGGRHRAVRQRFLQKAVVDDVDHLRLGQLFAELRLQILHRVQKGMHHAHSNFRHRSSSFIHAPASGRRPRRASAP